MIWSKIGVKLARRVTNKALILNLAIFLQKQGNKNCLKKYELRCILHIL